MNRCVETEVDRETCLGQRALVKFDYHLIDFIEDRYSIGVELTLYRDVIGRVPVT